MRFKYENMVSIQSKKKALSCRVSDETYQKVVSLIESDGAPFESLSEYLYTLVISDLARREVGSHSLAEELRELLLSEPFVELIQNIASRKNV